MIEKVCTPIEVFSLKEINDVKPAVDAVMNGNITLLKVGSVFSFVINPNIPALLEKFNYLKGREDEQLLSVVCSYEQAKQIVDRDRVNEDFFRLSSCLCSRALIRVPVDTSKELPFPYNKEDNTMQFIDFDESYPIRNAYREELFNRGCQFTSITSGNIHDAPTIEDVESAKMLAALFNINASFLGMHDVQTVVTDIPLEKGPHEGSYAIFSFCNPEAVEIKRLANKGDRAAMEKFLEEHYSKLDTIRPLVYAL